MKGKIFTIEEARNTLPLVRQITGDIVSLESERLQKAERYKGLYVKEQLSSAESEEMARLEADISNIRSLMLTHIEELEELGCFLKSSQEGLVDWYAEIEGRIVYLCWKLGEEDVFYYHDLESGVAGRKKIPTGSPI